MAALDQHFELLISVPLILEYEAVLTRPEHLAESRLSAYDVEKVLDDLISVATHVKLAYRWRPTLSDPDDDMVLETAVNGTAGAIVTFNKRDFQVVEKGFNLKILSPAAALLKI
jgi:predicted nucleic acid-binding protein